MVVSVLVEVSSINVDKTYDYLVPSTLEKNVKIGLRVEVPFGSRTIQGFILGIKNDSDISNLKSIKRIIDKDVILSDELLELGKWLKEETLSTLISCYQVMLPKALKAHNNSINKKYDTYYSLNKNIDLSLYNFNSNQELIISLCKDKKVIRKELVNISNSSLNTLLRKKILIEEKVEHYRLELKSNESVIHKLTSKQNNIYENIINCSDNNPCLIYGITGSGKTEIYMELINHYLELGKTSIVLVPEISLTAQLIKRFTDRFGSRIAVLHSALSQGEKYDEYRKISRGEVDIVIGARSAVFAPLKNIGIIIVDEEHSDSYKQENNPRYNAKDVAIYRSKMNNCKVVFGSATPSLEYMARAKKGVFHLLELNERVNKMPLPNITIVDMNKEKKRKSIYFSDLLIAKIKEKILLGEQIILLLNRRGYASFVTCKNCGYTMKCPYCDITLTYHKSSNNLRCHYCGYATNLGACPNCGENALRSLGVGTERIEEELHKLLDVRVVRMDYDTTTRKGSHERIINSFREHKYDILLGTQVVSKGLDFPLVTLVGVINADTSLNIPDFRSSEVTFSLLNQVSGRAGRSDREGSVIIQSNNPDHYAIKYAKSNDYMGFYNEEMKVRKILKYPPYYYLCHIRISGRDNNYINIESNKIKRSLERNIDNIIILGPSPSILYKINNIYRYGIIIKYKNISNIKEILLKIIDHYKNNNKITIDIDFNPNNMM